MPGSSRARGCRPGGNHSGDAKPGSYRRADAFGYAEPGNGGGDRFYQDCLSGDDQRSVIYRAALRSDIANAIALLL